MLLSSAVLGVNRILPQISAALWNYCCTSYQHVKKGQSEWTPQTIAAFETLNQANHSRFGPTKFFWDICVEMDASNDGIWAVLSHQGRPIAFMSKALGVSKRAWSIYPKDMLAIMEEVIIWRPYLFGRKFIICSDQCSLKYFLEQKTNTRSNSDGLQNY